MIRIKDSGIGVVTKEKGVQKPRRDRDHKPLTLHHYCAHRPNGLADKTVVKGDVKSERRVIGDVVSSRRKVPAIQSSAVEARSSSMGGGNGHARA
eukprot:CAMPEP_0206231206 /NCGR_PEP_ID=MMETSP0047_2-20121206/10706_1 /ASSEMBLY_ACC=CAM_ASM_000192 /TAXON_ID=195065 /ORGANISM="Chroomonas mesostigmatica_cf, Strain CCMP1168" /LENGTH=94 /DNA_ID=CAMNT_0053654755 /DNA_START=53 /DNA_END=337 /DNA_ORIENTATION=-